MTYVAQNWISEYISGANVSFLSCHYLHFSLPQFNANSLHIAPRKIPYNHKIGEFVCFISREKNCHIFQCIGNFPWKNYHAQQITREKNHRYKYILDHQLLKAWKITIGQWCILRYWIGIFD